MKKIYLIFMLIAVHVFTSCAPANNNEIKEQSASRSDDDMLQSAEQQLTVYCEDEIALFTNAIREYEQLTDTEVNLEIFEDVAEMEERITIETLSGGGPDLFLFSADDNSMDVHKMMKNGSFLALDELLEKEKSYSGYQEENYYTCMLDAGKYKNVQYILPLSFNMIQFYADKELIDTYYPQMKSISTGQELLQLLNDECNRTAGMTDYVGMWWTSSMDIEKNFMNTIIEQTQIIGIDYERNALEVNEQALEAVSDFYSLFLDVAEQKDMIGQKYRQQTDFFNHFSFMIDNGSLMDSVRYDVSLYGFYDKTPYVYLLSEWSEPASYTAIVSEYGAVNANSTRPQEAYALLRSIMDYQVNYDFDRAKPALCYNLPVNKDNLDSCMEMVKQLRGKMNSSVLPLRDNYAEYAEQLENILANITDAVIPNPKVGSIVNEVMQPYFMGEEEFDTCYLKLENRMRIYLSE